MTLDELYEIKSALEYAKFVDSYLDEAEKALKIVEREIELKTMDPRKVKADISGNLIEE
jgi:hypothetical protein